MITFPLKRFIPFFTLAWLMLGCTGVEIDELSGDSGLILQEFAGTAVTVGGEWAERAQA